jgi:hypothetical protein
MWVDTRDPAALVPVKTGVLASGVRAYACSLAFAAE